jgi:hypothetical protein
VERMTPDEFEMGKEWLNETFHLIRLVNLISFVQRICVYRSSHAAVQYVPNMSNHIICVS